LKRIHCIQLVFTFTHTEEVNPLCSDICLNNKRGK
jgi:hypothetical protein